MNFGDIMAKDLNMTFDIPQTPENLAALEQLRAEIASTPLTIYAGVDAEGNPVPVANISKHPDCPEGLYEKVLDKISRITMF